MRKSTCFLALIVVNLLCSLLLLAHARQSAAQASGRVAANRQLVRQLKLTDLCLFTEARYTRHPAMADRHAPFQDHPAALEHFPTGSLVSPPAPHREKP